MKIAALVTDLFFRVRIAKTAEARNRSVAFINSESDLAGSGPEIQMLIVDLESEGVQVADFIARAKALRPDLRIVAFGPHVGKEAMAKARAAGADEVLPRSRFSAELVEILG